MKRQIQLIVTLLVLLGCFFVSMRAEAQTIDDGKGACIPHHGEYIGVYVTDQNLEAKGQMLGFLELPIGLDYEVFQVVNGQLTTLPAEFDFSTGSENNLSFYQHIWVGVRDPHIVIADYCEDVQTDVFKGKLPWWYFLPAF